MKISRWVPLLGVLVVHPQQRGMQRRCCRDDGAWGAEALSFFQLPKDLEEAGSNASAVQG